MALDTKLFVKHVGNTCPVASTDLVVYRTTSEENPCSHIHHPIPAHKINLGTAFSTTRPRGGQEKFIGIGRILDYAVVRPKAKR